MAGFRMKGPLIFRPGNQRVQQGTATPESAVAAPIGSVFQRSDGSALTALYVKQAGTSSTGWAPMAPCASIAETVGFAAFTDGGGASGTYQMAATIPVGALLVATKIQVPTGFTGDTSAVVIIGDGSDTDRYMTGTPSVFTTAADGVECGIVSGAKLVTTANRPTITVTSGADFTSVAAGSITVSVLYWDTV